MTPVRIFRVQDDGSQQFVRESETLENAKELVGKLAELWPGEYVVANQETGERVVITSGGQAKN